MSSSSSIARAVPRPTPTPKSQPVPADPMRSKMSTLLGCGPAAPKPESKALTREQILEMLWDASPEEAAKLGELLTSLARVAPASVEIREKLPTLDLADDDILEAKPPVSHERPKLAVPPPPPPARAPEPTPQAPAPATGASADLMDALFETMYGLNFLESTLEAARFCLDALAHVLPTRAALVHALDPDSGDYRTIAALGPSAAEALSTQVEGDDWLISAAACKHRPLVVTLDGEVPTRPLDRHAFFGARASVIVAPVISWGRCLAVIELVDPVAIAHFDLQSEDAVAYVATRFADFIADHGLDEPDGVRVQA